MLEAEPSSVSLFFASPVLFGFPPETSSMSSGMHSCLSSYRSPSDMEGDGGGEAGRSPVIKSQSVSL